jgi:hypothetical protein
MIMSNTARFSPDQQRDDGKALFPSLLSANKAKGGFLSGALNMSRSAVMGHSMGGGNTLRVLAENPGYRCGIALAPWDGKGFFSNFNYPPKYGPKIRSPFLILHGEGDTRLAWKGTALRWFQAATQVQGLGVFWLFDQNCDHKNVARLLGSSTKTDRAVLAKILDFAGAWLDRYLLGSPSALERVLGPKVFPSPFLRQLQLRVGLPEFWLSGSGKLGSSLGLRLLGEPGVAVLFFAGQTGSLATPWGTLLLDPATTRVLAASFLGGQRRFSLDLSIPRKVSLVGIKVPFQGLALSTLARLRWSDRATLLIQK